MHISTVLVFWSLVSLVRNSVVLAVYLLFSVACFFTVHEHSSTASGSPLVARTMVSYGMSLGFPTQKHLHFLLQHLQGAVDIMPCRTFTMPV